MRWAIAVRALAGAALSGSAAHHPLGMRDVTPIGSKTDYATEVKRGLAFMPLVESSHANSLIELAVLYAISNPAFPTIKIGIATLDSLQQATAAVNGEPLSNDALAGIKQGQTGFVI